MSYLRFLIAIFCLFVASSITAQKGILKQANKYFQAEKYADALELYNKLELKDIDKLTMFRRGVSNFFTSKSDEAILEFTNARSMGYDEKDIYYYTARALHSKNLFVDASKFYKNYLRYVENDKEKQRIIWLIKQCKFGIDNQFNDQIAFVENLGPSVNTEYNEVNPVQSPTSQNKYYFSSNRSGSIGGLRNAKGYKDEIYGRYSADMYAIELTDGNWTPASAFHPILNGPKNDLIEGFNSDGSVMYFLESQDGLTGQMFSDTFSIDKDPEAFPKQLSTPVISELGDKDLQVFNNNTLIFASKRMGGYGGYDLYLSERIDGEWNIPVNLGPEINSKFDELDPFITKSGTKIYFTTNRIESLGGFDIYTSKFNIERKRWETSSNIGIPINSAMNDCSFSLSADGMTAIFSSDRPGSIGGSDLYMAYLKNQITEQLMYTEKLPFTLDGNETEIAEANIEKNETEADAIDDKKNVKKEFINKPLYYGKDEIIINPANKRKMDRVKDAMVIFPELHITFSGHSTPEGMKEFDLYFSIKRAEKAAEYLINNGVAPSRIAVKGLGSNFPHTMKTGSQVGSLAEKNNRRIDIAFINVPDSKLRILNEQPTVSESLKDMSFDIYNSTITGLAYKIQVAKTKQMYKADVIRLYDSGIIEKRMDEDIYTYTIGVFDSYKQARNLKSELLRRGILEATVVPYIDDQAINISQVQSLKDTFTDLNEYLKFESK